MGQQRLKGTYCKRSDERTPITSAGNYMRVQFTSDATVNRTGFSARAQARTSSSRFQYYFPWMLAAHGYHCYFNDCRKVWGVARSKHK